MRLFAFVVFCITAAGCAPLLFGRSADPDHVLASDRAHQIHHGRGVVKIRYQSPSSEAGSRQQVAGGGESEADDNPLPQGEGGGMQAGLSFGDDSTFVGDPSRVLLAHAEVVRATSEGSIGDAQAAELRACAAHMRSAGYESRTCVAVTNMIVNGHTLRAIARTQNGYLYPQSGSWQQGGAYGYYATANAATANASAFLGAGGPLYSTSGQPPIRERVGNLEGRVRANEVGDAHRDQAVDQQTDPEGGAE